MKKIFYVVFYIAALSFLGFIVMQNALMKRVEKYYNNDGKDAYFSNVEKFIDIKMYAIGAEKYLNEPLYSFKVRNANASFDFNIYHFQTKDKNKTLNALSLEVLNFESNSIESLKLEINGKTSEQFFNQTYEVNEIEHSKNWLAFIIIDSKNNKTTFNFNEAKKQIDYITEIIIKSNDESKTTLLAITDNENENLVLGTEVLVDNKTTNKFTGNSSNYYLLEELYKNENNYLIPNSENIKIYNEIIVKDLIWFFTAAIIFSIFIFLKNPIIKKIMERRNNKTTN